MYFANQYTGPRYTYGSYLRPWALASLPPEIADAVVIGAGGPYDANTLRRYPHGTMTFARRIPAAVCRQLSIEEVR